MWIRPLEQSKYGERREIRDVASFFKRSGKEENAVESGEAG